MADWRKLAVDLVLADNVIDEAEVKVLKKHLYEDGKIDKNEWAAFQKNKALVIKK